MKSSLPIAYFLLMSVAHCATIYSNFGSGGTFNESVGYGVVGPYELAYPFTVPAGYNYAFDSASLALSEGIGTNDEVTISLATNAAGVPGSILENLTGTVEPYPDDTVPVTVISSLNPVLVGGSVYWLIISPATGNGVNWLTAGILTNPDLQAIRSSSTGTWTATPLLYGYNNPGALSVDATALSPEGSTWSLGLTGIAILAAKRRWSKRQA